VNTRVAPLRHPRHRPHHFQHRLIAGLALQSGTLVGLLGRRLGVVNMSIRVAPRHHQRLALAPRHLTIARLVSTDGRVGGPWAKRLGAARIWGRGARRRVADAQQAERPTIAQLALPIGRQAGRRQRRLGVASKKVKVAQPRLAQVAVNSGPLQGFLEPCCMGGVVSFARQWRARCVP